MFDTTRDELLHQEEDCQECGEPAQETQTIVVGDDTRQWCRACVEGYLGLHWMDPQEETPYRR